MLRGLRTLGRARVPFVAQFSTRGKVQVTLSDAVQEAIGRQRPLVALESTIITHGLPYPANLEMATEVEEIIRSEGCVPATTAFIDGQAKVGVTAAELQFLATTKGLEKVSRRDIPSVIANKQSGGTTIAGTMILAHKAGIDVFATGGLGGVHRGVADTWDVSADLDELGQTPVAVFCSGPKSILDIPKTIEYLETKGVYVATRGEKGVDIPGFFSPHSGVVSPFNFTDPAQAASVIRAGLDFGLNSGYVFCIPVPEHLALPKELVDSAIEIALAEAETNMITGKEITPFLLQKVWELTQGDTVATNIAFVKNNARVAAQTARELSISRASTGIHIPVQVPTPSSDVTSKPEPEAAPAQPAQVAVIGAIAQDITCTLSTDNISISSYPGQISTSLGGVGYNVALAAAYTGKRVRLVSEIGDKDEEAIMSGISPAIDTTAIKVGLRRSAKYVSMNDSNGALIVACSDMDTIARMDPAYIKKELRSADAEIIVFDANLGPAQTRAVLDSPGFKIFEPTSIPKSALVAEQNLGIFPNASIDLATPNSMELMSMFEEFSYREKFTIDRWFPIIESLGLDSPLSRQKVDYFIQRSPAGLGNIVQSGLLQAAVHQLPYIPNLFVKLGAQGVLTFQLIEHLRDRTADLSGVNSLYFMGNNASVLVQHFPVPIELKGDEVKSVNGIGDTFCGVIASLLADSRSWLRDSGEQKLEAITKAQTAAALSLQTFNSVNSDIADLF